MDFSKLTVFLIILLGFEKTFLLYLKAPEQSAELSFLLGRTAMYTAIMAVFWGLLGYVGVSLARLILRHLGTQRELVLDFWQRVCLGLVLGLVATPFI